MTDTASRIRTVQCHAELLAIQEEFGHLLFREQATAIIREHLPIESEDAEHLEGEPEEKPAFLRKIMD